MLLLSYAGMALALMLLSLGVAAHKPALLLFAVFGYVVMFSVGAGPVCWLLASEVLPTQLRAKGMMMAVVANRAVASLVSLTFLSATSDSAAAAFAIFAVFCCAVWVFVYYRCPETKGRSLEDMSALFNAIARHHTRGKSRSGQAQTFASRFAVNPLVSGTKGIPLGDMVPEDEDSEDEEQGAEEAGCREDGRRLQSCCDYQTARNADEEMSRPMVTAR